MSPLLASFVLFSPEVCLILTGLCSLVLGAWPASRRYCLTITWAGIAAAALIQWRMGGLSLHLTFFDGMLHLDGLAYFAQWLILTTLALTVLMSEGARELDEAEQGEYYGLLTIASVGLMMFAAANHLLMAVLAMETVSLSSYLLVAYQRRDPRSAEAGLKYFLFGALASGCMLYGIAWLYGLARTLRLDLLRSSQIPPVQIMLQLDKMH